MDLIAAERSQFSQQFCITQFFCTRPNFDINFKRGNLFKTNWSSKIITEDTHIFCLCLLSVFRWRSPCFNWTWIVWFLNLSLACSLKLVIACFISTRFMPYCAMFTQFRWENAVAVLCPTFWWRSLSKKAYWNTCVVVETYIVWNKELHNLLSQKYHNIYFFGSSNFIHFLDTMIMVV